MVDSSEGGADLVLVAQLCSKLCHDLAGTIGAIANGAELLADEDDADIREQALGLLAQSAEQAARRLKFYRIAFGAGGSLGDRIDLGEFKDAVEGQFGGGRVKLDWSTVIGPLGKQSAKLLANLLLVAVSGMPRGGIMRPTAAEEGGVGVVVVGDGAAMAAEMVATLEGGGFGEGTSAVAAHAALLAKESGSKLSVTTGAGQYSLQQG